MNSYRSFLALIIFGVFSASGMASEAQTSSENSQELLVAQEKQRLEELFISKMSEELKLSTETAKAFGEVVRALNREKAKSNAAIADSLIAIHSAQNAERSKIKKETEKAVRRYEAAWRAYGEIPLREVARLRKVLGTDRLGQYLVAKSLMAEKITALSVTPAPKSESKPETKPETK